MSLPTPNLDDRRFQDLVDEAKRRVQQHCPEWTDHNVSDPGVTLIEAFAHMVDELLYRLNRVPDLHYLRFLDLIGVELFPPTAARAQVTFWLAAPRATPVVVPGGAQVATERNEVEDPVVFTVDRELTIVPCELAQLVTAPADPDVPPADRTDELVDGKAPGCFADPPAAGDAVLFGLSDAVPGCAVLLRVDARAEGRGVDPRDPPWQWEAWHGTGWSPCEVDRDSTGGFNQAGDVVVHVPRTHAVSVIARQRAGWLRCRAVEPAPGRPFYQRSPKLVSATAATIGGTTDATHADIVRDEVVGVSEGVPGQRFPLARTPVVVNDGALVVEVAAADGAQRWTEVRTFAESGPGDRHVVLDRVGGEVIFGPAVRQPDGGVRNYGAVPPKSAAIRVPEYRTGGGTRGNVARGLLQVQRDPVPFVSAVTNRLPASGGVAGETVRDASLRGPLVLRTRDRAVTAEDYELLTREAAPEIARVRCVPAGPGSAAVRVLVVPAVAAGEGADFGALQPGPEVRQRIERFLDDRRCVGARVSVEPPYYQGVTVVARLRARAGTPEDVLRARAVRALYDYFDPIGGGPDGDGWPFGRPVQSGEVFAVLQRLPGVELVEEIKLFGANPVTGERGNAAARLDLPPNGLAFSYGHQVRVTR
ncbi:putative baseplate assembly protein [Saccharothrix obliqua]|uniref:putative baseplate assembly protein n=1 Tax=Saccharothrix obliqua TaxID=2861747 RepID=UPI001C6056CE|nr:putative baseplate assembly protein [Saccharothrix obliqua]MBW4721116.1 putative baseplate assembly protein [Saccharothrix obliqua]